MAISMTLAEYLKNSEIPYDLLKHKHTTNSYDTAYTAHIPMAHLAKAVVLKDETGHRLMAVVPSMNHLKLRWINKKMNHHYDLVGEMELKELFRDCELGAIPALGQAFQMETICDDQLLDEPVVYLEGGDHEALIKLRQDEFSALMASVHHDRISMNNPQYSPYHDADLGGY